MIEDIAGSFTVTRTFDAPSDLVFRVFTEAEFVSQWWGCDGAKTTVHALDVRPGGNYDIDLQMPDGSVFSNRGTYVEVVPNRRLVSKNDAGTTTIVFEEREKRTTATLVATFPTQAAFERATELGLQHGISKNWNAIERILREEDRRTHAR